MLHNICKQRNIPLPDDEDDAEAMAAAAVADMDAAAGAAVADVNAVNIPPIPGRPAARIGHRYRDYVVNLHFK